MAFRGEQTAGEDGLEDLTKAIIDDILHMPGNDVCCDCGAPGAFWLYTGREMMLTCTHCISLEVFKKNLVTCFIFCKALIF